MWAWAQHKCLVAQLVGVCNSYIHSTHGFLLPSVASLCAWSGTLRVEVHGDWLPRTLFSRFYAFFAYLRNVWCPFPWSRFLLFFLLFSFLFFSFFFFRYMWRAWSCTSRDLALAMMSSLQTKYLPLCQFSNLLVPRYQEACLYFSLLHQRITKSSLLFALLMHRFCFIATFQTNIYALNAGLC